MSRYDELPFRVTDRQQKRITETATDLRDYWGLDCAVWPNIAPEPESRPGRGHDLVCFWGDGEQVATLYADPYGNGPLVVSYITVIHNDSDDECSCQRCASERAR